MFDPVLTNYPADEIPPILAPDPAKGLWPLHPEERKLIKLARRLFTEEEGTSLVEYALLFALIGAALASSVPTIGSTIGTEFKSVSASISNRGMDQSDPGRHFSPRTLEVIAGRSKVTTIESVMPVLVTPAPADRERPATTDNGRHVRTIVF